MYIPPYTSADLPPTRFVSFPPTVPRPPVRLYILFIAYERAIPLICPRSASRQRTFRLSSLNSGVALGVLDRCCAARFYLHSLHVLILLRPFIAAPLRLTHGPLAPLPVICPGLWNVPPVQCSSSLAMSCSGSFSFVIYIAPIYVVFQVYGVELM